MEASASLVVPPVVLLHPPAPFTRCFNMSAEGCDHQLQQRNVCAKRWCTILAVDEAVPSHL